MDVKAMSAKQYMDEMVVPTLLKALSVVNQKVRLLPPLFFSRSRTFTLERVNIKTISD